MKDDSFWIVVEDGKPLKSGIRCDEGKEEAKNLRRSKELETGLKWSAKKVTKKELAACSVL